MLWLARLRLRIRSLRRGRVLDEELSCELAFHLAQQKAEYISAGMTEVEAQAAAKRLFGSKAALEEQCRDERRVGWLEDFLQDTRFAWRSFSKSYTFPLAPDIRVYQRRSAAPYRAERYWFRRAPKHWPLMNTDEHGFLNSLTEQVLGAVFEVSNTLGAGFPRAEMCGSPRQRTHCAMP